MSGAAAAAEALRDKVREGIAGVANATKQASHARELLLEADDIVPVMQASIAVILAAEAVKQAAADLEKKAREALAASMEDTGCHMLSTNTHTASLRDAARSVQVTDEAAIPPALMRQPPPAPDKIEIGKLLRAGQAVPGTELSNGGPMSLQIRSQNP